jgi:hypothetical protein
MNADAIREFLHRKPFDPFVIRMSNGGTHEVRHPECLAIGKGRIAITDPDADRVAVYSLVHVTSIESLPDCLTGNRRLVY